MAILLGCSKEEEPVMLSPDSLFAAKELVFEGLAGEQRHMVEFEAPKAWTAEIHSIGSWLKADKLYGEAGKSCIIIMPRTDNFGITAREAELEIYIDGYEAYTMKVYQESASTGDIKVNGHINDGLMTLKANELGTEFEDTIWVKSSKKWTLKAEDSDSQVLSFDINGESKNGEETEVQVVVKAMYSKFGSSSYEGKFYIQTAEGTAVPITVKAMAEVGVYANERTRQDETECASLNFTDTIQKGVFMTEFYVESNIRWTLGGLPDWIESASSWNEGAEVTNVLSSGKIDKKRHHVSLRVKSDKVSTEGKTGTISLLDANGETLKKVSVTFAGVGSGYLTHTLSFNSEDPNGNPWGFESKASRVNPDDAVNYWKTISKSFEITTSVDYTSLADAPYHLILVRADNGIARKEEVHWAKLEMAKGNGTENGGLYTHEVVIRANDRGDADDKNGITKDTYWRHAIALIVPRSVSFQDLWNAEGKIKDEYANDIRLIAQKNDPDAKYEFRFEGVAEGETINFPAEGGSKLLNIAEGSYNNCDFVVEIKNAGGEWINATSDICKTEISLDSNGNPVAVSFSLSKNTVTENPITHVKVGAPRHLRVIISAFIGNEEGKKEICVFYMEQNTAEAARKRIATK